MAPTQLWQGEYDGWRFGHGTVFHWSTSGDAIVGLEDLPDVRGSDHPLPGEDGLAPGSRWLGGRQLILQFTVTGDDTELRQAVNAFKRATRKRDVEAPLYLWLPEQGIVQIDVRPGARAVPVNELFSLGVARAMVEFVASDPRLYGERRDVPIPVFVPAGGGFDYPVDYPKDYGGESSGGTVMVPNDGDADTWPRFVITGPSNGGSVNIQRIENVTDGTQLDFTSDTGLTISAGRTVIVETHPARRTVAFTDGASRWNTAAGNVWWPIHPGGAALRLRATGDITGVTCTVQTRDAWL